MISFKIALCSLAFLATVLGDPYAYPEPYAEPGVLGSQISRVPKLPNISANIATRLPSELLNILPNAADILALSKEAIAGLPFEVAFKAITEFCSAAIATNAIRPSFVPELDKLNFYLMTRNSNTSIPLTDINRLVNHSDFDRNKPVAIFVTGWNSNINNRNDALYMLLEAYKCRGTHNFMTIDTGRYVDTFYLWSSFNTEAVGEYIGKAVAEMVTVGGISESDIHLIGHSLGAHIVGSAAREFQERTGYPLPRITGLDPAMPCFREGEGLYGLQKGDAEFVDVIHSNCDVLGNPNPLGDIDFYPNGKFPLQPGCVEIICAHHRAVRYYAESVLPGNENNFLAVKCNSLKALSRNRCRGQKVPMGFATPTNVKGNYFLYTNQRPPFGKDAVTTHIPKCPNKLYYE